MSEKAYFKNSIDPNKQKQDIMFNQFKVIYHPHRKKKIQNKQTKSDVSHLRIFGSITRVHVLDERRTKLDDRSERFIFIGYE